MGFDWLGRRALPGTSVRGIRERLKREQTLIGWTHEAPDGPLTVGEAHRITQQHRDCRLEDCPRKRTAWQTLVEAGKIKPDSGRNY
ncbi:hypothetical protein GCM10027089_36460 [Nocardia thraciensis]